jgi:uncharacterized protein involved in exopolysaccharide biosynthesis
MMNDNSSQIPAIDTRSLLRGWRTILISTAAAILIGAAFTMTIQPQQQVGAKLIVEPRAVDIDGKTPSPRDREFLPTQAEILRSPSVIASAVRRTDAAVSETELANHVIKSAANLKIDPLAGTSILQLQYTDSTSQRAADFVNALVEGYREYLAETEKHQHKEMLELLTARDSDLRAELATLHGEYETLKQEHAGNAGADAITSARILAGLEESLATIQSHRLLLQRAEHRLQSGANPPLTSDAPASTSETAGAVSGDLYGQRDVALSELSALSREVWSDVPDPTDAIERMRQAQSLASELRVSLGPQHPELRAAEALVARYEQELTHLAQTALAYVQRSLESMRMQEEALQARYDSYLLSTNETNVMRLKESQKLAEIDRAQRSYETVHAQLTQWQLVDQAMANGRAETSVSMLERPTPAERSFAANPLIVMGVAGLLGLMFGVSWLAMLPQLKSSMNSLTTVSVAPSH